MKITSIGENITEKLPKLKNLRPMIIRGKEYLPIIEGGKGIGASNGESAGAFARENAIGTFSGVNAESYDENGNSIPQTYEGKTRLRRHEELIEMGIEGGVHQAKIASDIAGNQGRVHMNILWEMGGAEKILHGILDKAKGLVDGVTCGAGMPYKLGDIAEKYNVDYFPIVSSMRAFRALWKRAYSKTKKFLGGVVYEDPWLAGGHNGLSNSEDPSVPQTPYERVRELRTFMNKVGLKDTPIIMAGGVWHLRDWQDWFDNDEVAPVAFQFGTRPLLTKESPIPQGWKDKLTKLAKGEVYLNRFSPTGFYSSAVENSFLKELIGRSERQVEFRKEIEGYYAVPLPLPPRGRKVYITPEDKARVDSFYEQGYTTPMKTPDDTLIFVTEERSKQIVTDQIECMGCLSHCKFSNWKDHDDYTTGKKADPRSYCIQKTLQNIIQGDDPDQNLMFAGHNAYKFGDDPFYKDGFIPTVKQLIERIQTGY
jgi:NAD(P)H-dependent flavin oxidoreductase YrpB (nitropropane dioxygenase family)